MEGSQTSLPPSPPVIFPIPGCDILVYFFLLTHDLSVPNPTTLVTLGGHIYLYMYPQYDNTLCTILLITPHISRTGFDMIFCLCAILQEDLDNLGCLYFTHEYIIQCLKCRNIFAEVIQMCNMKEIRHVLVEYMISIYTYLYIYMYISSIITKLIQSLTNIS